MKKIKNIGVSGNTSEIEKNNRQNFLKLFKKCPIPENEILNNLGLFIKTQDLKRVLFMKTLYKKIIDVNGIIIEFGTRWGQNLALFESFRGIYEPFNHSRKIVGFDTFCGFNDIHAQDGKALKANKGNYSVSKNYENYLEKILKCHEQENPIPHIKKFDIYKGDAAINLKKYLNDNPETIIAFAYFDMDLYEPTKKCLNLIKDHITKGTILGFDELNAHAFPGETLALKEMYSLNKYALKRNIYSGRESYIVIE